MKREILFRGKRVEDGKWVYGCMQFNSLRKIYWIVEEVDDSYYNGVENVEQRAFNESEIDPETLCEYTGLRDKNGTRIFEGDIIKYKNNYYNDLTAIVEQKEARYGIWDKTPENKINNKYCFIFNCICMYWIQIEVIGNIHDNKKEEI